MHLNKRIDEFGIGWGEILKSDVSLIPIPYDSPVDRHELTTTENSGKSRLDCLLGYRKNRYGSEYDESGNRYNLLI